MMFLSNSLRTRTSSRWICHSCKRRVSSNFVAKEDRRLPLNPARTRFAPSPTGYLHLGSLRTALYNYLLAKATGGSFVLRIEDTDQKRTIPDAEQRLYRDLEWAGLQWDEGPPNGGPYGPYKQSSRLPIYQKHAEILLGSGHAYRCFCTQERLQAYAKKRSELGQSTEYDRTCASIPEEESQDRAAKGEAHVTRLKAPPTYPPYKDLVYGKQKVQKARGHVELYPAFQDPIIVKTDGFPTYHLANVVDDHLMKISHVVRGAEWMTSTHAHLALYEAFNWEPPQFAHVGLLTDQHGQKLSKRKMDTSVSSFRDNMGIFPDALTNFVALLGWSHGKRSDVMNLQELVENFTVKFTKGDAVVTYDKLWYLQKVHAARYAMSERSHHSAKFSLMTKAIRVVLQERGWVDPQDLILGRHRAESYLVKLIKLDARNYTTPSEFVDRNKWFFQRPDRDTLLNSPLVTFIPAFYRPSWLIGPTEAFNQILSPLELISSEAWTAETIRDSTRTIIDHKVKEHMETLKDDISNLEVQKKAVAQNWATLIHRHIRWIIAAGSPGPDGAAVMEMLGRDETMIRFAEAANVLATLPAIASEEKDAEVMEARESTQ